MADWFNYGFDAFFTKQFAPERNYFSVNPSGELISTSAQNPSNYIYFNPNEINAGIPDGSLEDAKFREVSVDKLIAGTITSESIVLAVREDDGDVEIRAGISTGDFDNSDGNSGFILGVDDSDNNTPKFFIGNSSNSLEWDGDTLTITGSVTATSGTIGGFEIGPDYIRDVANSFGLASTVTGGDDVRFWAGDTFANRATADFRLTEAGALTATNATITGSITSTSGSIGGFDIGSDYIRDTENSFGLASTVTSPAAITASTVTTYNNASPTGTDMISSVSIPDNQLVLMFVTVTSGSDATAPTNVWDAGATWEMIGEDELASNGANVSVWRRCRPGGTLNVVIQHDAINSGILASLIKFTGVDTRGSNGENAIGQIVFENTATGTSTGDSLTMGAFESSGNATVGYIRNSGTGSITQDTDFTTINTVTTPGRAVLGFDDANQGTITWSWSSQSTSSLMVGVELRARQSDVRFWAGDTYANRTTAPISIYDDGRVRIRGVNADDRMLLDNASITLMTTDSEPSLVIEDTPDPFLPMAAIRGINVLDLETSTGTSNWNRVSLTAYLGLTAESYIDVIADDTGFLGNTHIDIFSEGSIIFNQIPEVNASGRLFYGSDSGTITTTTPRLALRFPEHHIFVVRDNERAGFFGRNTDGSVVQFINNGSSAGNISNTGTTTAYNATSDRRIKQNIVDTRFGLDDLEQIQVRDYELISNPNKIRTGLIAQELYEIYPEAVFRGRVRKNKETGEIIDQQPWGIDYGKLTPLLIKSVQELSARVKELEKKNK